MGKKKKKKKRKDSEHRFSCSDYRRLPGGDKCQHYTGNGGCKRADYFMCTEWLRVNEAPPQPKTLPEESKTKRYVPDSRGPQEDLSSPEVKRLRARFQKPPRVGYIQYKGTKCRFTSSRCERPRGACRAPIYKLHEVYPDDPRAHFNSNNALVVDLRGEYVPLADEVTKIAKAFLKEHPEDLDCESVKQLEKLGAEVQLSTGGKNIWLVPKHTDQERIELTYEHIRGIVLCLSAFPGAKLKGVVKYVGRDNS